jgi:hypothetical protein
MSKSPATLPVDAAFNTAQVLTELKKADLTAQDVLKIEKILRDKGLVSLIIRKDTPQAELFTDYLSRFWDYDRSYRFSRKSGMPLDKPKKRNYIIS